MSVYATPDDVAAAWRPLTADERTVATSKLAFASAIVRAIVPSFVKRYESGALDAELVKGVVVEMVLRALKNPDGVRQSTQQVSIDDYSRQATQIRDQAVSAGGVYLTDAELALLSPLGSGAFSIAPTVPAPTCADLEAVAQHRAWWNR